MNWVSLEELFVIHEMIVDETGGVHGVINLGGLDSSLARPFTSFQGQELFPDLWSKVAALIHSIIAFHPFVDGNKRVALVSADVCLRMNGYRLIPSEEIEPFFWSIARGEKSVEEITQWIQSHSEPWKEKGT
ncbi:MAG: type II toxin-antitoxin system death-on-curing family toxin [Candidatus Brocadia sp. AMX2]|uniref:Prophage maintenance system killer protein n=1 Tax=Candidatus Brocadia sinica JPN1 TaxID=1197129 RepID=A0ABQ0JSE4_9BACT|nr:MULTISPECIES: type II toxin-antitoxin system death-on-curing family toxin [Brocadia]MBC6933159.1 type II toxin-antitoxin system death-on-curing family toxin [Candidatus Brocadia sp.]MBL1168360.1 type II toxin-antitoxin system death-on-curing family toxin [Candidatus Brocadia sp. AMX1]NOG43230.1 type II toxin-antitoxin system death-on-curing family toxin [Planctomycetota bacterium]GIK12468.1 MAG: death-on-curing protein [Candidatus Brocadia sinica]GJQ47582.1 MAG: death-on-curing protein [Can